MFRIADELLRVSLDDVAEIVRLPRLAHMPLGPRSLLGLANLRGVVLPVVSLRRLLGFPGASADDATRVIVIDRGAPVGFLVDRIEDLLALSTDRIEKDDAGAGFIDPDLLEGVIKGAEGDSTIKILNPERLLRDEFAALSASAPRAPTGVLVSQRGRRRSRNSRYRSSASSLGSRNTRCRSIAYERSFRCRSMCRRWRAPKPPCWAW